MNEFYRNIKTKIERRLEEKSPLIQIIIGPRQVGKTTALKQALQNRGIYCTADSPTPLGYEFIEQNWRLAVEHSDRVLAIDEIQKIAGWSNQFCR